MSKIVLYGLQGHADGKAPNLSPYVWKTRMDLDFLGIPYDEINLSYVQISKELTKITGIPDVTVPTINDNGSFISDSWAIAEYLEEMYAKPAGKSLFLGSVEGKAFARFLETYPKANLGGPLAPLACTGLIDHLDQPSKEYYSGKRFGSLDLPNMWAAKRSDAAWVAEQVKGATAALGSFEALLKGNHDAKASSDGGLWVGGTGFSHADAGMFGLYCWTRLSPELKTGVWENEQLPYTKLWLEGMKRRFVKSDDELY